MDAHLGFPATELPRLARLAETEGRRPMPGPEHLLTRIVTMNGALVFPGLDDPHGWNAPVPQTIELPRRGRRRLHHRALRRCHRPRRHPVTLTPVTRELSSGPGHLGFDTGSRWGSAFLLPSPAFRPMHSPTSFSNDGAGGQFTFADPTRALTFAYTTNRMIGNADPRANNLAAALPAA
ncbi:hypothetical protein ACIQ9P_12875 [Kitasatospora sp. NPDC094019]|uniref:hypothetical protein n=1 Tax=Kitasatospora sp. NPDC094019 TaxID=3364091 RepID=UPI0037FCBF79